MRGGGPSEQVVVVKGVESMVSGGHRLRISDFVGCEGSDLVLLTSRFAATIGEQPNSSGANGLCRDLIADAVFLVFVVGCSGLGLCVRLDILGAESAVDIQRCMSDAFEGIFLWFQSLFAGYIMVVF